MKPIKLVALSLALSLASLGCTTWCVVGVRDSAAVVCAPDEPWGTCLEKVERDLAAKQQAALELLQRAAAAAK